MEGRRGKPMLLIDLAVPRDIDAACGELEGVSLYDIDDLQAVIDRNRRVRQAEARTADGIVEEEIQHFAAWLGSLEVLPTVAALRGHADEIAAQVISENRGKWESASPRDLQRVEALARAIVSRLLHEPTVRMKEISDDRVHMRTALMRELFGLNDEAARRAGGRRGTTAGGRRIASGQRSPASALIRVGTRGSALALAQAEWVAAQLQAETQIVPVRTSGDRGAAVGDKSRWVSELERALLEDRLDIAVHSAKDVPAELPPGLSLVAVPQRADPRDAICGASGLDALPAGARVGTSSLRRTAQLRALREDLDVVELGGNVDTRLRKLADGLVDAAVLACAGLERLGRLEEAGGVLDELVPAAGQGALFVEGRGDLALDGLGDPASTACVLAERELTQRLGASCNTPVGAYARALDKIGAAPHEIELRGWVGRPDGSQWISDRLRGSPHDVGSALAERMLAVGATELLR